MNFEFATSSRIIFGAGEAVRTGKLAAEYGNKTLLVHGGELYRIQPVVDSLKSAGVEIHFFSVTDEPTLKVIEAGVQTAREANCQVVIGAGGGSVIDTGKAVAAMLANPGELLDYLEVVGLGKPLQFSSAPYLAVPTTAGTGSEVTRNAVIGVPEQGVKVSMRSVGMLPKIAIIDPVLTYSMPPAVTASTGLDAFAQVIEPYVGLGANPMTDLICREGILRASISLVTAYDEPTNQAAREDMSLVSAFGGMALANAKLGAVHGFAAPIGGMYKAPHGAVCACLLPVVMKINSRALDARLPESGSLARYLDIARWVTGNHQATIAEGVVWLEHLVHSLHIPKLSEYGIRRADFPAVIEKAKAASSMKGNPIRLTDQELVEILDRAI